MTDAFPVPNPWEKEPTDFPITKQYVEGNLVYTTVCPICYCTVNATDLMEKHLDWHKRAMLEDRHG